MSDLCCKQCATGTVYSPLTSVLLCRYNFHHWYILVFYTSTIDAIETASLNKTLERELTSVNWPSKSPRNEIT